MSKINILVTNGVTDSSSLNIDGIHVTFDEQTEAKDILGCWIAKSNNKFEWMPGILLTAAETGQTLYIEGIENCSFDVLLQIMHVTRFNYISVPFLGHKNIAVHPNFNVVILHDSNFVDYHHFSQNKKLQYALPDTITKLKIYDLLTTVNYIIVPPLDIHSMIEKKYSNIQDFYKYLYNEIYTNLNRLLNDLKKGNSPNIPASAVKSLIDAKELINLYSILKLYWCEIQKFADWNDKNNIPDSQKYRVIEIIVAVLLTFLPGYIRTYLIKEYLLSCFGLVYNSSQDLNTTLDRLTYPILNNSTNLLNTDKICMTSVHKSVLSCIANYYQYGKPILLVGPVGAGKSLIAQSLSAGKCRVFSINEQTESSELIGSFVPVSFRLQLNAIVKKLNSICKKNNITYEFDKLNLEETSKHIVIVYIKNAIKSIRSHCTSNKHLIEEIGEINDELNLALEGPGIANTFNEGILVECIRNGYTLILDEINLADPNILSRIIPILSMKMPSFVLYENGYTTIQIHHNFRLIATMNPRSYITMQGKQMNKGNTKKDLPVFIKKYFKEIFVDDIHKFEDISLVIRQYDILSNQNDKIASFFYELNKILLDNKNEGCDIYALCNMRTIIRCLEFVSNKYKKNLRTIEYNFVDAAICYIRSYLSSNNYIAFDNLLNNLFSTQYKNFMKNLDGFVNKYDNEILKKYDRNKVIDMLKLDISDKNDKLCIENQYYIDKGLNINYNREILNNFICSVNIRKNLRKLLTIIEGSKNPILLEGHTSVGKTSLVQYLCTLSNNTFIRINNHDQLTLSEYFGYYQSDHNGEFSFVNGPLLTAMLNGYWVVLDEFNLAPGEVIEGINRVLDDNRCIYVPELGKTIYAHKNFRLFATQNPAIYGGRKKLSDAIKNRFIQIIIEDLDIEDIKLILLGTVKNIPESIIIMMAEVYQSIREKKIEISQTFDILITLRDLIRWTKLSINDINDFLISGMLIIGERLRTTSSREEFYSILTSVTKKIKKIHGNISLPSLDTLYNSAFISIDKNLTITNCTKRLQYVISWSIKYNEPLLLIGATGTGKTTVIQSVCQNFGIGKLYIINVQQNTDVSDFIGSFVPVHYNKNDCVNLLNIINSIINIPDIESQIYREAQRIYNLLSESINSTAENNDDDLSYKCYIKHIDIVKFKQLLELFETKKTFSEIAHMEKRLHTVELDTFIKQLDKYSHMFQWKDGIFVRAMIEGIPILIDEINLGEDAVIERINSVLEDKKRTIFIPEREENIIVHENFRIFATMNPGGDYGKKELSKALRNRFYEVYIEPIDFESDDCRNIITHYLKQCNGIIDDEKLMSITNVTVEFFRYLNMISQNPFSIREIVTYVQSFISIYNELSKFSQNKFTALNLICQSLIHSTFTSIIDGYSIYNKQKASNINIDANHKIIYDELINKFTYLQKNNSYANTNIKQRLLTIELYAKILSLLEKYKLYESTNIGVFIQELGLFDDKWATFHNLKIDDKCITLKYFSIYKNCNASIDFDAFIFNSKTTCINLSKIFKSYYCDKAILLEGEPGTGKTAIIIWLAKALGKKLYRFNLCEQTELSDLIGSYAPNERFFEWKQGGLTDALINGDWVLLDELNLAPQPVIEGLNSLLDNRKNIYIADTNTYVSPKHGFKLFATQNRHSQGGGRKGLPASLLNRFIIIDIYPFDNDDLTQIFTHTISKQYIEYINDIIILLERLKHIKWKHKASKDWEWNIRDVQKIFQVTEAIKTTVRNNLKNKNDAISIKYIIKAAIDLVCKSRLIDSDDIAKYTEIFNASTKLLSNLDENIINYYIYMNLPLLYNQVCHPNVIDTIIKLSILLNQKHPILITGSRECGKMEAIIKTLDKDYVVFNLSPSATGTDLLGEYVYKADKFVWQNSTIIDALITGKTIVFTDTEYCNSGVFDRLNSLLELNPSISISENNSSTIIIPHENFRIILLSRVENNAGISAAIRNRCIEIGMREVYYKNIEQKHSSTKFPNFFGLFNSKDFISSATLICMFFLYYKATNCNATLAIFSININLYYHQSCIGQESDNNYINPIIKLHHVSKALNCATISECFLDTKSIFPSHVYRILSFSKVFDKLDLEDIYNIYEVSKSICTDNLLINEMQNIYEHISETLLDVKSFSSIDQKLFDNLLDKHIEFTKILNFMSVAYKYKSNSLAAFIKSYVLNSNITNKSNEFQCVHLSLYLLNIDNIVEIFKNNITKHNIELDQHITTYLAIFTYLGQKYTLSNNCSIALLAKFLSKHIHIISYYLIKIAEHDRQYQSYLLKFYADNINCILPRVLSNGMSITKQRSQACQIWYNQHTNNYLTNLFSNYPKVTAYTDSRELSYKFYDDLVKLIYNFKQNSKEAFLIQCDEIVDKYETNNLKFTEVSNNYNNNLLEFVETNNSQILLDPYVTLMIKQKHLLIHNTWIILISTLDTNKSEFNLLDIISHQISAENIIFKQFTMYNRMNTNSIKTRSTHISDFSNNINHTSNTFLLYSVLSISKNQHYQKIYNYLRFVLLCQNKEIELSYNNRSTAISEIMDYIFNNYTNANNLYLYHDYDNDKLYDIFFSQCNFLYQESFTSIVRKSTIDLYQNIKHQLLLTIKEADNDMLNVLCNWILKVFDNHTNLPNIIVLYMWIEFFYIIQAGYLLLKDYANKHFIDIAVCKASQYWSDVNSILNVAIFNNSSSVKKEFNIDCIIEENGNNEYSAVKELDTFYKQISMLFRKIYNYLANINEQGVYLGYSYDIIDFKILNEITRYKDVELLNSLSIFHCYNKSSNGDITIVTECNGSKNQIQITKQYLQEYSNKPVEKFKEYLMLFVTNSNIVFKNNLANTRSLHTCSGIICCSTINWIEQLFIKLNKRSIIIVKKLLYIELLWQCIAPLSLKPHVLSLLEIELDRYIHSANMVRPISLEWSQQNWGDRTAKKDEDILKPILEDLYSDNGNIEKFEINDKHEFKEENLCFRSIFIYLTTIFDIHSQITDIFTKSLDILQIKNFSSLSQNLLLNTKKCYVIKKLNIVNNIEVNQNQIATLYNEIKPVFSEYNNASCAKYIKKCYPYLDKIQDVFIKINSIDTKNDNSYISRLQSGTEHFYQIDIHKIKPNQFRNMLCNYLADIEYWNNKFASADYKIGDSIENLTNIAMQLNEWRYNYMKNIFYWRQIKHTNRFYNKTLPAILAILTKKDHNLVSFYVDYIYNDSSGMQFVELPLVCLLFWNLSYFFNDKFDQIQFCYYLSKTILFRLENYCLKEYESIKKSFSSINLIHSHNTVDIMRENKNIDAKKIHVAQIVNKLDTLLQQAISKIIEQISLNFDLNNSRTFYVSKDTQNDYENNLSTETCNKSTTMLPHFESLFSITTELSLVHTKQMIIRYIIEINKIFENIYSVTKNKNLTKNKLINTFSNTLLNNTHNVSNNYILYKLFVCMLEAISLDEKDMDKEFILRFAGYPSYLHSLLINLINITKFVEFYELLSIGNENSTKIIKFVIIKESVKNELANSLFNHVRTLSAILVINKNINNIAIPDYEECLNLCLCLKTIAMKLLNNNRKLFTYIETKNLMKAVISLLDIRLSKLVINKSVMHDLTLYNISLANLNSAYKHIMKLLNNVSELKFSADLYETHSKLLVITAKCIEATVNCKHFHNEELKEYYYLLTKYVDIAFAEINAIETSGTYSIDFSLAMPTIALDYAIQMKQNMESFALHFVLIIGKLARNGFEYLNDKDPASNNEVEVESLIDGTGLGDGQGIKNAEEKLQNTYEMDTIKQQETEEGCKSESNQNKKEEIAQDNNIEIEDNGIDVTENQDGNSIDDNLQDEMGSVSENIQESSKINNDEISDTSTNSSNSSDALNCETNTKMNQSEKDKIKKFDEISELEEDQNGMDNILDAIMNNEQTTGELAQDDASMQKNNNIETNEKMNEHEDDQDIFDYIENEFEINTDLQNSENEGKSIMSDTINDSSISDNESNFETLLKDDFFDSNRMIDETNNKPNDDINNQFANESAAEENHSTEIDCNIEHSNKQDTTHEQEKYYKNIKDELRSTNINNTNIDKNSVIENNNLTYELSNNGDQFGSDDNDIGQNNMPNHNYDDKSTLSLNNNTISNIKEENYTNINMFDNDEYMGDNECKNINANIITEQQIEDATNKTKEFELNIDMAIIDKTSEYQANAMSKKYDNFKSSAEFKKLNDFVNGNIKESIYDKIQSETTDKSKTVDEVNNNNKSNTNSSIIQIENTTKWKTVEELTSHITSNLTEVLRTVLEPTNKSKYQGNYKTGKKLSMKQVISYIATDYRNDKIWLRRTKKAQRNYNIYICIDNSSSMKELDAEKNAMLTLVAMGMALQKLEAGHVNILSYGQETIETLLDKFAKLNATTGEEILSKLKFDGSMTGGFENSMKNLLEYLVKMFDSNESQELINITDRKLVLIISDGRFAKDNIRKYLTLLEGFLVDPVLIIIDNQKKSIYDIKEIKFLDGKLQLPSLNSNFLNPTTFPFKFYLVINSIKQLESTITTIIKDWVAMNY